MERISSRSTWIGKVIFPIFWFGGMGIFVVLILLKKASEGGPPLIAIIAPIFLSVYGYFMMKNLVWDLADGFWTPAMLWSCALETRAIEFHLRTL